MKGYMYILECAHQSFYVGSTYDLMIRFDEHQRGEGSNYTKERLPLSLFIMKNLKLLVKHFEEKNKFKDGAEQKKLLS